MNSILTFLCIISCWVNKQTMITFHMCQMWVCYYSFNLYAHEESIWKGSTCAKYKRASLAKTHNELFLFLLFLVTENQWFFSCLSPFYHELVNERVNEILMLTKMQEGEDAQKHIWEKNIWSNEYVKSRQCWP